MFHSTPTDKPPQFLQEPKPTYILLFFLVWVSSQSKLVPRTPFFGFGLWQKVKGEVLGTMLEQVTLFLTKAAEPSGQKKIGKKKFREFVRKLSISDRATTVSNEQVIICVFSLAMRTKAIQKLKTGEAK